MPGVVMGRTAGKAGEHGQRAGDGRARRRRRPSEIDGVEHSDVPEEYREQVGRTSSR